AQSEFYRHVVKPAGPETAIEMPQARNDDADHGRLDVGPGLIEHEEIEAGAFDDVDAGQSLLARIEAAEFHIEVRPDRRFAVRDQIRVLLEAKRAGAVIARLARVARAHQPDRQELIDLGQRAQQRDARIEVRAGTIFDELLSGDRRIRHRHIAWNAEIGGDVEHPQPASGVGELVFQIADVRIVELAQVQLGPLRAIVPPNSVRIPLHQLEEALDDRLLER